MSATTGIEWCDSTWNPIRGCSRVSRGCEHCYAERVAYRFSGPGQPYEGLATKVNDHASWTGKVALAEEHLLDPLKWKPLTTHRGVLCGLRSGEQTCNCPSRPRRVFVNSMSDLFHPAVPDEWIDRIFAVMALCPQHTFQVLTKRPERMLAYWSAACGRLADVIESMRFDEPRRAVGPLPHLGGGERWFPLSNVHLGVSVEDQKTADERIPLLLQTPAAVRFISAEPLLGAIDLTWDDAWGGEGAPPMTGREPTEEQISGPNGSHFIRYGASRLDWAIVGGESGPGARPMQLAWCLSLAEQCKTAGVPFFMKQGSKANWKDFKNIESFPKELQVREFPNAAR